LRRAAAIALLLAGASFLAACRDRRPAPAPRPSASSGNRHNVLLVTIDTLRADHLGAYGYRRPTSPRIDALARAGTVFESAYTYWPKTRGSMAIMLTGRTPSRNGYSKTHPMLLDFNPTLASVLKEAGYATAAIVDNPNVAAQNGYGKGFDSYRETWEEAGLATEADRMRAITDGGIAFVRGAPADRPFFLWLHYVNPHAPYTPPPPFDKAFLDAAAASGPRLGTVPDFHGGIPKRWAVRGQDRLGYYVAQYDGEIAAVDQEVGRLMDALQASAAGKKTVMLLTSDHGESLGEHDYYFDHGEDLFEPSLAVPLVAAVPGGKAGVRSRVFASTLDVVPTLLDAVKVSYPPDLAGISLLAEAMGKTAPGRERLFAQNDRNLIAAWDRRFKIVGTPEENGMRFALYDRASDPAEKRDVGRAQAAELQRQRDALQLFVQQGAREWEQTQRLIGGVAGAGRLSPEACAKLQALGYLNVPGCGS
jgi:arylsulfatase A-like enzyme